MCVYDYDTYEVFRRSTPTARRRHNCYECGRVVEPGERYERAVGLFDGRWDSMATCPRCLEARRFLDVVCHGQWLYGDIWEELYCHVDELDCASGVHLIRDDLARSIADEDELEDRVERIVQWRTDSWSHEGAALARLVRSRRSDLSPADIAELAQQAIELWNELEPA